MAVDTHRLLAAVNQAGEVPKQKRSICIQYLEMNVGSWMGMVLCFVGYMR